MIALEDLHQLLRRQLEGKGEAKQVAAHHGEAAGAHIAPQLSASAASQLAPVDVRGSIKKRRGIISRQRICNRLMP